ncbi:hypothetical protein KEM48_007755 [Puccinia striiformis f. sp. tritici PST-130]|nr:hypothetical protein KEM48_007755 [Puccinia striiformis f. sp. tritici PST-130]
MTTPLLMGENNRGFTSEGIHMAPRLVGSIERDTVQNFIASIPELREQGITASLARDQVELPESAKGREGLGLYKRTCTGSPGG